MVVEQIVVAAPEATIPIVLGGALLDSINPCVIGVLILLLSVLIKSKQKKSILLNGFVYTLGVYVTYLLGGITLLAVFNTVREVALVSQMFYMVIGSFVILAGFLEIKDFFWYGHGFSLAMPKRFVSTVETKARGSHRSLLAAFMFGVIVTLVELPCTGAPYLAVLSYMSQSGMSYLAAMPLLLLYNLVFIAPLLFIIYLAYSGVGLKKLEKWRKDNRGLMRLFVGLFLAGLGVWIISTVASYLLLHLIGGIALVIIIMALLKYIGGYHRDE